MLVECWKMLKHNLGNSQSQGQQILIFVGFLDHSADDDNTEDDDNAEDYLGK